MNPILYTRIKLRYSISNALSREVSAGDVLGRVAEGNVAEHVGVVVDALVASREMVRVRADALGRHLVDRPLETGYLEGTLAGQHRGDEVEGNVLAVELGVDKGADLGHEEVVRRVVVKKGDAGKGETRQDHGIRVAVLAKVVLELLGVLIIGDAARKGADEAVLVLAPGLEDKVEVLGVVVDVVVGEQDGLGAEGRVGPELLVEAVAAGHAVADRDVVAGDEVGGCRGLEIVPDDDDLFQRGDLGAQDEVEGCVEVGGSLVGLNGDAESKNNVSKTSPHETSRCDTRTAVTYVNFSSFKCLNFSCAAFHNSREPTSSRP